MKILITGINGFVGKILKPELESEGHVVSGLDLESKGTDTLAVDITDPSAVEKAFFQLEPDYVFHLAAISRIDFDNPQNLYNINVNGTVNCLSAASKLKNKPSFMVVSSSQVYGDVQLDQLPITESHPVSPVNHYGASKAAGENISLAFHRDFKLPVLIVRPFNHIGKGQALNFVVPKLINAFKTKESSLEMGNIDPARDFLDVRDIIKAYMQLMNVHHDGSILNVASETSFSIRDIIAMLTDITSHTMEIKTVSAFLRKNEIMNVVGSYAKLHKLTGWKPNFSLKETLQWIIEV